ncbi:MAG: sigma-70 family RNA polymerase sigma factor [Rhizobiales bacterium]|nr:sigma-70 family RNA polymerase sigma factor [Hyphomicrobiales bacterium]
MVPGEAELHGWMVAALAGDAAAYRRLLEASTRLLRRYFLKRLGPARAADADDLVQETLLAIHSRRATYEPDRPFTVWLHAIARYRLIDHFRRSGRRPTVPIDDVDEAAFASDSDESAATNLDLDRLLATVPPETRKMIRQVKIEGQAIADVAAETGRTPTAVKVGIHRGLRRITARLRGGEGGS